MRWRLVGMLVLALGAGPVAAKTPQWLRDLAAAPVPAQGPEVEAVQLLDEVTLVVAPDGQMRRRVRGAVRVLRQSGESRATIAASSSAWGRVKDMQGWTIPASGKDFEVGFKDAIETSVAGVDGSELVSDVRTRVLAIPGARPGATVGYEFEEVLSPLEQADDFSFQDTIPVLRARYTLQLPPGWTVTSNWVHYPPVEPARPDATTWQWTWQDLAPIELESWMPSWRGVAGRLFLSFAPAGGTPRLSTWQGISSWYTELARDRLAASDAIRAKVAELVQGKASDLEKVQALAAFVQKDIRYVAIELGIGGFQPHAAADVFGNRYGDCKDKATLLAVMLKEIGIDSYTVLINTDRSTVGADTPAGLLFNHAILAVRLSRAALTPEMYAVTEAGGETLLIFDPTDSTTPLGRLSGALQGSRALLTGGGQLLLMPGVPAAQSGVRRTAELTLDAQGKLSGSVVERMSGDAAASQRYRLRAVTRNEDLVKPLEARLAGSLAAFQLQSAVVRNLSTMQLPLEWRYSLVVDSYARRAGELMMVRPRVFGVKSDDLEDDGEQRIHDVVYAEARIDEDEFTIALPEGFVVDSLPDPVDMDVGFAAYRSRTEVTGSRLKYTRRLEQRELRVPAGKFEDFRRLNRAISRDERAVVVLKGAAN